MANTIRMSSKEWKPIRQRLKEEYQWKPSVLMIRECMRRELGFVIRIHHTNGPEQVCLDFYDDNLETLFRLKYL